MAVVKGLTSDPQEIVPSLMVLEEFSYAFRWTTAGNEVCLSFLNLPIQKLTVLEIVVNTD